MADLVIDVSELTLGDMQDLMNNSGGDFNGQMGILNRIVVSEGGARAVKIKDLPRVMELVQAEVEKLTNPPSVKPA
jgi:hypothetical protein